MPIFSKELFVKFNNLIDIKKKNLKNNKIVSGVQYLKISKIRMLVESPCIIQYLIPRDLAYMCIK